MGFQIMFDQANSFYLCAHLCEKELDRQPGRHDLYSTPMIVNSAFACEVYIKTLLDFYNIPAGKKHNLDDLFQLLPDEVKDSITKNDCSLSGRMTDAFGLSLLKAVSDAFVTWRYSYEKSTLSCDVGFLKTLTKVLQAECASRLYGLTWEQYCKLARIN